MSFNAGCVQVRFFIGKIVSKTDTDTESTHPLFSMPLLIKGLKIFEDNMQYERQNQNI